MQAERPNFDTHAMNRGRSVTVIGVSRCILPP